MAAESSSIESRIYQLSDRLGSTQGQVTTLFTLQKDLKESMQSIAGDIGDIKKDVHAMVDARQRIDLLERQSQEFLKWKAMVMGGFAVVTFVWVPLVEYLMSLYVK